MCQPGGGPGTRRRTSVLVSHLAGVRVKGPSSRVRVHSDCIASYCASLGKLLDFAEQRLPYGRGVSYPLDSSYPISYFEDPMSRHTGTPSGLYQSVMAGRWAGMEGRFVLGNSWRAKVYNRSGLRGLVLLKLHLSLSYSQDLGTALPQLGRKSVTFWKVRA